MLASTTTAQEQYLLHYGQSLINKMWSKRFSIQ